MKELKQNRIKILISRGKLTFMQIRTVFINLKVVFLYEKNNLTLGYE